LEHSNAKAPDLRVSKWIDANGQDMAPLKLADLGERLQDHLLFSSTGARVAIPVGFQTLKYLH